VLLVRLDQRSPQLCQGGQVGLVDQQLVGIASSVMLYGHGFATSDELGAATSKVAPATEGQLGRSAVGGAVPAFHRLGTEAVADDKTM
jgi:hypothetical protein